ncbi:MAG: nucleotidyltransferase domain-containing protein [Candidatus Hydrogenedentota bacterium]
MRKKKHGIDIERLKHRIVKAAKYLPIKLIVLFGSAVKSTYGQLSDIDIGILFNNKPSLKQEEILLLNFTKRLPEFSLDIVILNHISPLLGYFISRDGICLYARNASEWHDFRLRLLRNYRDTKKFRKRHEDFIKNKLSQVV